VRDRWPLVGRDDELARLRTAAEEAAAGQGQLALVTGESGIGKTALIGALAADVEGAGTVPLWGVCWEDGSAPAFWPWVQLARGYAQQAGAGQ
jgi:predicted ATPase